MKIPDIFYPKHCFFSLVCFAEDSFSSTNSSRSASTITRTTAVHDKQTADDEPTIMRPVRTGRAKPTCYVCVSNLTIIQFIHN